MATAAQLSQITRLADSWELHLPAERKSPTTIAVYQSATDQLSFPLSMTHPHALA